jgi:hypothetical protein
MPTSARQHPTRQASIGVVACLLFGATLVVPASAATRDTDLDGLSDRFEQTR